MAELTPDPSFASDTGLSLGHGAHVASARLVLSGNGSGAASASWTSPEEITEGWYRYDITVDATDAPQGEDECCSLSVAGKGVLLYGTGSFQGAIWTHLPANQIIQLRNNDPDMSTTISHCSIVRE